MERLRVESSEDSLIRKLLLYSGGRKEATILNERKEEWNWVSCSKEEKVPEV